MREVKQLTERLKANVSQVFIGKTEILDLLLVALVSQGHVLLEDAPGIGKTTLITALARSLGLSFGRIQFTPDIMPSEITGYELYQPQSGTFAFRSGLVMRQIILADEINRASPKTQSALLEVMQEHQVTVGDRTIRLPEPFMVLATQNAVEFAGTFPLPEAQLDRFMMKLHIGYPDVEDEMEIYRSHAGELAPPPLAAVLSEAQLLWLQEQARRIYVAPSLLSYIAQLAKLSRSHPSLRLGASPRAALMLVQAAKGLALIMGREYVVPQDIERLIEAVWAHRLLLNAESRLRKVSEAAVLSDIFGRVPAPRER